MEFVAQRTLTSINDLNLDADSIITLENRETNDAYTITTLIWFCTIITRFNKLLILSLE